MSVKNHLPKVIFFVLGLMAIAWAMFLIIWFFPGSMYGYGPGLEGLEAIGFILGAAILIGALFLLYLITLVTYLIRKRKGIYGEYTLRTTTIWRFWLPMSSVFSIEGTLVCLVVALLGPKMVPLIISQEKYREIEQERKLLIEFALRSEQAPWATQAFLDEVQAGDLATINKYLRYGADPGAQNYFGQTALHIAVLTSNEKLVEKFLDLGVSIDARDREKETPLHDACKKRNLEIVLRLIEAGADIHADSDFGTPLDIAEDYQYREAIELLKSEVN